MAIGGACTTPEMVERYGVDALGRDAVEAIDDWSEGKPALRHGSL